MIWSMLIRCDYARRMMDALREQKENDEFELWLADFMERHPLSDSEWKRLRLIDGMGDEK